MQDRIYFTREEAEGKVGLRVEAVAPFPSVPKGTRGDVVKASRYVREHYVVKVRWQLPRPNELVDLTIPEFSFNFIRKKKPVTDEFCKSEFDELVRVLGRGERA